MTAGLSGNDKREADMKIKNEKIWKARTALAKLANADLPLPAVLTIAPLLDACEPVIDFLKKMDEIIEVDDDAREAFGRVMGEVTELPPTELPCLPGIVMTYVDYAALREIAGTEEI